MKKYPFIIEKCRETGYYVGYIPNIAGAHSQASTIEELKLNMLEVLELILEDNAKNRTQFLHSIKTASL